MRQEPPFAIQVEFTEGCNLFCKFCGIRGIRDNVKEFNFMSIECAANIARQIKKAKWNPRIEFAMHGEPTLNPSYLEIIGVFRSILSNHQLTILTNGTGLLPKPKKKIDKLFYAGVNIIAIDNYKHNPYSKKIIKEVKGESYSGSQSPHTRFPKNTNKVIYIQDIREAKGGGHSVLNNHCGCAFPPLLVSLNKRCAKPFRELSIRYNGKIALCCNDWRGYYSCGRIRKNGDLEDIWNGKEFSIVRKLLYHNNRNFIPCKWCDALSYRVGFLPDKMGKKEVEKPTVKEIEWINKHVSLDRTMANIVKRPWEKSDMKRFRMRGLL